MSYILDALRRADAERDRGGVPGLHTQQYGALPGDDEPPRSRLLVGAVVALSLALAAVLAWQFLRSEPTPPTPAVVPTAATPAAGASATAAVVAPDAVARPPPVAAPTPPAADSTAAATKEKETAGAAKEERAREERAARAARAEAARERRARRQAPPKPTATDTVKEVGKETAKGTGKATDTTAATRPGERAAGDDRLYTRAELPEPIRRELPQLAVGGASYSKDPASRMVILNGQVFHEGDKVAPGLVLQTIKLKAAVLAYKGYRFELAF